jgi:hypothetical protein
MGLSRSRVTAFRACALAAGTLALVLALAGCPTVSLGEVPPDIGLCEPAGGIDYFNSTIWPKYIAITDPLQAHTCLDSGCHGHKSFAGGMGFDETDPTSPGNYLAAQSGARLNCGSPEISTLLTRPLAGVDGHGGGDLFRMSDPEYQTFLDWFK